MFHSMGTALFISSCSDDDDSAQGGSSSQGITTVEAIIPEPMLWNTDNTIALYAKKADSEKDLFYTEDSQVSEATFEAVKKAFPTPEEGDYIRAFYPAGKAKEKANAASTPLLAPGTDPTDTQNVLYPERECDERPFVSILLYVRCQCLRERCYQYD